MTAIRTDLQNSFETTLTAEMGPNDLVAQVTSKGALVEPCYLVIEPDSDTQREYILFNGTPTASQFTIGSGGVGSNRYLAGSAAGSNLTHPIGSMVRVVPMAQHFEDLHDRIDAIDHTSLQGLTNDDHTQYTLVDGSRGFSAAVTVGEPVVATDAATKSYVDAQVAGGIPAGVITAYGGISAPGGYLLCDGTEVSRATYNDLFLAIGTAYGAGDGSTTFDLPDLRGRFPLGVSPSGTGSTLGEVGGSLDFDLLLAHSHDLGSHTHSINHGHADTISYASAGSHTHAMPNHSHTADHDHAAVVTSGASVGAEASNSGTSGLVSADDITNSHGASSSSTSHSHGDGSYNASGVPVTGTSSTNSASHTHASQAVSKAHTHTHTADVASVSYSTSSVDPGDTFTSGSHTHTRSGSVTDHTGNSGSASGTSDSGLGTVQQENPPFQTVNYIIKT